MSSDRRDTSSSPGSGETAAEPETTQQTPVKDMSKRTQAVKEQITRYFSLLTEGCGKPECRNEHCASSPAFAHAFASNNDAAAEALRLLGSKAPLCDEQMAKQRRTEEGQQGSSPGAQGPEVSSPAAPIRAAAQAAPAAPRKTTSYLDLASLQELISACKRTGDWRLLIRTIGNVFYDLDALEQSFVHADHAAVVEKQEAAGAAGLDEVSEEGAAALPSSSSAPPRSYHTLPITVDLPALTEAYDALFAIEGQPFLAALIHGLVNMAEAVTYELRQGYRARRHLHVLTLALELPSLSAPELLESALPALCRALASLPLHAQATLCQQWSERGAAWLEHRCDDMQQMITLRIMTNTWGTMRNMQEDSSISSATRTLKLVYCASLVGGTRDSADLIAAEKALAERDAEMILLLQMEALAGAQKDSRKTGREDRLEKLLRVRTLHARTPLVPFSKFVNEVLNDNMDMESDFNNYKINEEHGTETRFSFLHHPFILTTLTKSQGLFFDNKIRQIHERRNALLQSIMQGEQHSLYLRLRVNRSNIINDALVNLELVAMDSPQDLKKQLFVEFEGEQGIDEGGVSKEFFQLIVEKIFNPDVGMFRYSAETRQFWFNPQSLENDGQYTLIGIVLGLAIYNNVILDVHFPRVVYRKLLSKKGTLKDLMESHPTLARSLQSLLEHPAEEVEEDLMLNFVAGYSGLFDAAHMHELKPRGKDINVTGDNRQEFVDLYVDFLLNESIQRQFAAFKRGFALVTEDSPLAWLFRPEELELLIVGSRDLNFEELEEGSDYDGGYTADAQNVKNFWSVLKELTEEQKRHFLRFTTGSDRAPIGGLGKLKLVLVRHGPDSDRLPSAHTCFNVLLLPDYSSREKLKERLLKAIVYSEGFGMM